MIILTFFLYICTLFIFSLQEKYRKQAYKFYDDFNADLDDLIQVADEATLKKAEVQAEKELSTMPKVLFTDKVKQSGISGSGGGVN